MFHSSVFSFPVWETYQQEGWKWRRFPFQWMAQGKTQEKRMESLIYVEMDVVMWWLLWDVLVYRAWFSYLWKDREKSFCYDQNWGASLILPLLDSQGQRASVQQKCAMCALCGDWRLVSNCLALSRRSEVLAKHTRSFTMQLKHCGWASWQADTQRDFFPPCCSW